MDLIPSIDLRHGRVVRLRRGDDRQRTTYDVEALETLLSYRVAGIERVHVVDLDAAFGEPPQRALIESLAGHSQAPLVQLGGGLRDRTAVEWAFECGCERVVITSLMVRDFDLFGRLANEFPGRLVAAFDIDDGRLKLAGWTEAAAEGWRELAAALRSLPLAAVLVTDIQRDGTLDGPNLELAREVALACAADGLLSGGVQSLADLASARRVPEIVGAIVGRALYDGAFTIEQARDACIGVAPS